MKRIISFCTVFVLIFSTMFVSFANSFEEGTITPKTIITEENINGVLDYLGIEQDRFIKSDEPLTNEEITVGELGVAITKGEEMAKSLKINFVNEDINLKGSNYAITNSVKTVYRFTEGAFAEIGISGTGEYSGSTWTRATGANVFINSDDFGFTTKLNEVRLCRATISSGLKVDYDFTTESFFIIQWGLLSMGEYYYEGFVRFPTP